VAEGRARRALSEDAEKDITSEACIGRESRSRAIVRTKQGGIVCGIAEANAVLSPPLHVKWHAKEGSRARKGSVIAEIDGSPREILRRERTALNYLCHLSGIATESRLLAKRFGGRIASLRKTHPCISASEKRAVAVGGCLTHRLSLSDGYLVKNNHISAIAQAAKVSRLGAIGIAVDECVLHRRRAGNKYFIGVEVASEKEAVAAARTKADAILVDNQPVARFRKIARAIRRVNKSALIEASGGITPENAGYYLRAGADFCSTSWLTSRARPLDIHLELK
jgi:nicotinate-nucleotide pyrophosphorylase (carboxylating)